MTDPRKPPKVQADATRVRPVGRGVSRIDWAAMGLPTRTIGAASPVKGIPLPRGEAREVNPDRPLERMLGFAHAIGPTGQIEQAGRAGYDLGMAVRERDLLRGVGALAAGGMAMLPEGDAVRDVAQFFRRAAKHPTAILTGDALRSFNRTVAKGSELPMQEVPLADLLATQGNLYETGLQKYATRSGDWKGFDAPVVARVQGQHYILDGHHRLAAEAQRGATAAHVRYVDADTDPELNRLTAEISQLQQTLARAEAEGDVAKAKMFRDWIAVNEADLARRK